jgi:hypothetical protein
MCRLIKKTALNLPGTMQVLSKSQSSPLFYEKIANWHWQDLLGESSYSGHLYVEHHLHGLLPSFL